MLSLRLARNTLMLVAVLMLTGCVTTTQTSSEIKRIICETADFYRFKPYRETYAKLTAEEKATLKRQLDAYRREGCGR
jgi:hypothetical protein